MPNGALRGQCNVVIDAKNMLIDMLMSNNMYVYIYIQPYVILYVYIYYSISYLNLFTIYSHRFSDMRITSNNPFLGHAISICAQALALTPHFSFTSLANLEAVRIDGAES